MPVRNNEIADVFEKLADLLEIEGANPFRIRAYRTAAQTVRGYPHRLADLVEQGADLTELSGVGGELADKIRTYVSTGELPALKKAAAHVPAVLTDLLKISGLGPKRVQALHRSLGIRSLKDLERAARARRVRRVPGFGARTEAAVLRGLARISRADSRTTRPVAEAIAGSLTQYLKGCRAVKRVVAAGSFRRCAETVGDLDILVSAGRGADVMAHFVAYDEVSEVISRGDTRCTVRLRNGMQIDLRRVPQVAFGSALQYFTGSRDHNIALRKLAAGRGLKLNEYGLFDGETRVAGKNEKQVYARCGLDYIEPELRENRGEIEAAARQRLPELVKAEDMRGDLHCHTRASDGRDSLRDMAKAARQLGREYLAISDHSKRVTVAHGLDAGRLARQLDTIDRFNEEDGPPRLLKSCEVDILEDGSLDMPDEILARLDVVLCSVHYRFELSRQRQTDRIIRAMDNPHFNILGHPTGRLINRRAPYEVDLERLMRGAVERGCFMELNANPNRLDLDADACRMARELGLKVAISTDAHNASALNNMRYGVEQARRGWLCAGDVINTRSLRALRRLLRR
jgi:DNA polymerase (family 10)